MVTYENPRRNVNPGECVFYHVCELPGIGTVGSQWDLREHVDDYLGRLDYTGKTALDIGTAGGFLTFEMEKRGAQVTSVEMASPTQYQFVPYWMDRPIVAERLEQWGIGLEMMKNGYWLTHELRGSKARAYYGDVYNLPESLGQFDVVVVGMILPHLQNPCRALEQASLRSREAVVVTQGIFSDPQPIFKLMPEPVATEHSRLAWFAISDTALTTYMEILGFGLDTVHKSSPRCVAYDPPQNVEVSSFVFRRKH